MKVRKSPASAGLLFGRIGASLVQALCAVFFDERLTGDKPEPDCFCVSGDVEQFLTVSDNAAAIRHTKLSCGGGTIMSGGGVDDHGGGASFVEQAASISERSIAHRKLGLKFTGYLLGCCFCCLTLFGQDRFLFGDFALVSGLDP